MIQYTLQTDIDPGEIIRSIAFSPDGRLFAVGISDGILVYQISSGRLFLRIYTLSAVLCLCWDVRGDLLCGCRSGYVTVITLNLALQTVQVVFSQASKSPVSSIAIHATGAYLAMREGQLVSIWRYRKRSEAGPLVESFPWIFVKELEGPKVNDETGAHATPPSVAWMDVKKFILASSYGDQGIRVWDIEVQEPVFSVPVQVFRGSLSPCGRYFANSNGKSVTIIEMETCVDVAILERGDHLPSPTPVIWVHGGGFVLNARKGQADLWHVSSKQCCSLILTEELSQKPVTHLASFMGINNKLRSRSFQIALVSDQSRITIWTAEQAVAKRLSVARAPAPLIVAMIGVAGAIRTIVYYFFIASRS